jgi:multiple sugar transport system permease protein
MNYKGAMTVKKTVIYILMILFTLIALVPIYLMLINATRTNAQINSGISLIPGGHAMDNWKILTSRQFKISQGFLNSAFISISATVLGCYFSALTAYAMHVYRFKGRAFLWAFILFIMMLPASLSFIGFYQFMAKIHLTNNYIPLIIPAIASANTVLFIRQYMASVLSLELIDAGRIDGAGEFRIFNIIILPIVQPALATQAIFGFVGSWNNFVTPMILLQNEKMQTLPVLVQKLRGDIYRTEYGAIYVGIAVSLIPIIIFYAILSRYIISGLTMGSVKE